METFMRIINHRNILRWRDIPPLFRFVAICAAILVLDMLIKLYLASG